MRLNFRYKITKLSQGVSNQFGPMVRYEFRILEQDERIYDLINTCGYYDTIYVAKNGYRFHIISVPEINTRSKKIYLATRQSQMRSHNFTTNPDKMEEVEAALKEFCQKFCHQDINNHRLTKIFV